MTLRQELAAMVRGYRTTEAAPEVPEAPVVTTAEAARHAHPARGGRRGRGKRATLPAKDLSPETMDPSPEQ